MRACARTILIFLATLIFCVAGYHSPVAAQTDGVDPQLGAPVVLQGETLFYIEARVGSFSPQNRATAVSRRIKQFAEDVDQNLGSLRFVENEITNTVDIQGEGEPLISIVPEDAQAAETTQIQLARQHLQTIRAAVASYRESYRLTSILKGVLLTLALTIALILGLMGWNRLITVSGHKLRGWQGKHILSLRMFKSEILTAERVVDAIVEVLQLLRVSLWIGLGLLYISLVLSCFPWTRGVAKKIFGYFATAARTLSTNLVAYLPNLFFIFLIVISTFYTLRLIKFFFTEIEQARITIPSFHQEWSKPTYNIIRFTVIAFMATVIFPYLPGSKTEAFKGVSVFLGILFSLGSSGAVANFVAGVILTYSRAFVIGDRVKISESVGDVIEKTLLVTRINTPKNVVVTIPNAMVLSSHIVNYSGSVSYESTPPLVLHTTITLGYDVPWPKVHAAMVKAAQCTEHVLADPSPFVLQTSLDDFYVSYELNAYTEQACLIPQIYSGLHQNLQDALNEAGIEILSPHYSAMRDGHQLAVPAKYFPPGYTVPGFRVSPLNSVKGSASDASPAAEP